MMQMLGLVLLALIGLSGCYRWSPECRAMASECTKGCPEAPVSGPNPEGGWGDSFESNRHEQRRLCLERCYEMCMD